MYNELLSMSSDGGQCLKMSFWTVSPLGVDVTVVSSLVLSEFSHVSLWRKKFLKAPMIPQMIKFDMVTLNILSYQTHNQLTIHEVVIICLGNGPWKWYSWSEGEPFAVGMALSLSIFKGNSWNSCAFTVLSLQCSDETWVLTNVWQA